MKYADNQTKKKKGDGYAVLRGTIIPWGTPPRPMLAVFCPYCDGVHTHGVTEDIRKGKKEHRVAHCFMGTDSPLGKTGYFVATFRKKDIEELKIRPCKAPR